MGGACEAAVTVTGCAAQGPAAPPQGFAPLCFVPFPPPGGSAGLSAKAAGPVRRLSGVGGVCVSLPCACL